MSDPILRKLQEDFRSARDDLQKRSDAYDDLPDDASSEQLAGAREQLRAAADLVESRRNDVADYKADPEPFLFRIREADMYHPRSKHSFLRDLYESQVRHDPAASERIGKHQAYERDQLEKRAVSTGTLGGAIPPQFLLDLWAKAPRTGRVFADQIDGRSLPDEGMSIIIPRITTPSAAGVQTAENQAVSNADVGETDLTVPVRTIAGFAAVSRQLIERSAIAEDMVFEDLIARVFVALDQQLFTGSGSSGQLLGLFNTSGVGALSAEADGSIATLWTTIANAIQSILTKWGGLGLKPDKIVMHPRRWAVVTSALDENNRPLFGFNNMPIAFNPVAAGVGNDYGFAGYFQGLPVYTDANVPTDLDTNTDKDAIVVTCSNVQHLWEPPSSDQGPPVMTLRFDEQAGTSLETQLVAYQYAAATFGRYPDSTYIISDFPAPTF